jgi:hypothetical protein
VTPRLVSKNPDGWRRFGVTLASPGFRDGKLSKSDLARIGGMTNVNKRLMSALAIVS